MNTKGKNGANLRLELCRAEDPPVVGSVQPPKVTIAKDDYVAIAARIALFGVRHAPVKTLGTWHTRTVEHPPANTKKLRGEPT
jgi:hypothetical protein